MIISREVRFSSRSFYITFVAGSFGDLEIFLIFLLTQRHTLLTRLTGLTRLGNESLLCDEIILTQRGKEAEEQRRMKKTLCLCVSESM